MGNCIEEQGYHSAFSIRIAIVLMKLHLDALRKYHLMLVTLRNCHLKQAACCRSVVVLFKYCTASQKCSAGRQIVEMEGLCRHAFFSLLALPPGAPAGELRPLQDRLLHLATAEQDGPSRPAGQAYSSKRSLPTADALLQRRHEASKISCDISL